MRAKSWTLNLVQIMNKKRYSIEQIKVALALFDKVKNVTRTVRQLGYPSKNQLYEWINHRESSNGAFPEISSDGIRKKKVVCPIAKAGICQTTS